MRTNNPLDCVVIGHNETPFETYERLLREYGEGSEAYRDLQFSFVDLDGKKMNYVGLMNHVFARAGQRGGSVPVQGKLKACAIPNLAAVYLTHYLRRRNFNAEYISLFQHEKERLADYLEQDPLCVAITTTLYLINRPVKEIVEFIRRHNERVPIVVGGPLIANHFRNYVGGFELEAALQDIGADLYVVESQGERTLAQIVACLKAGDSLRRVPNLAYFDGDDLCRTPVAPEMNSLDENFIDWRSFAGENLGATVQTRTARSCAFSCAFCNYPTRAGRLTLADLDTIEAELDSIRALGNVENVVFIDDTFNVPLRRFKEICRLMIEKEYGFNWFSYFRCSNADEETIELMARSGCTGVFLGVESGSPRILKNMHKAATVGQYRERIALLHEHGILTFASLIAGFPGETAETVAETVDFIQETQPTYYRVQLWYCEKGTPIEQRRDEFGIQGDGFIWEHETMDSLTAMDYIDRMFLTIDNSIWLPQWSFDFWIIPYLLGKGITLGQFEELMQWAHKLLSLEIAVLPQRRKHTLQTEYVDNMVSTVERWQ